MAIKIKGLDPLVTQDTTDIYELSKDGAGSYKETRSQMALYSKKYTDIVEQTGGHVATDADNGKLFVCNGGGAVIFDLGTAPKKGTWFDVIKVNGTVSFLPPEYIIGNVTIGVNYVIVRAVKLGDVGDQTWAVSNISDLFLPLLGSTMLGNLILNADATLPLQAVTYQQFLGAIAGFTPKVGCYAGTTANLNTTYNNGASGVGATLTANVNGAFATDGVSPPGGSRIFVLNQTDPKENGLHVLTTVGNGSTPYVLTRATDFDTAAEIVTGAYSIIENGDTLGGTMWYLQTTGTIIVGTTGLNFAQANYTMAGTNLVRSSANTLALDDHIVLDIVDANTVTATTLKADVINGNNTTSEAAQIIVESTTGNETSNLYLRSSNSNTLQDAAITLYASSTSGGIGQGAASINFVVDGNASSAINFYASPAFTTLTASRVVYLDSDKKLASSSVTPTQLSYVDFTSSGQTQLDAKLSKSLTSAHLFVGNGSGVATDVAASGDVSLANTGAFTVSSVNSGKAITLANSFTTSGNNALTLTTTGTTNVTLPTSGNLINSSTGAASYEAGSFTIHLTGPWSEQTGTVKYVRIGSAVTLQFPTIEAATTGTAAISFAAGEIPASLRPATTVSAATMRVKDSGSIQTLPGDIDIFTTGGGTIYKTLAGASFSSGGGIAGVATCSAVYNIN